jgi:hypothetical protein
LIQYLKMQRGVFFSGGFIDSADDAGFSGGKDSRLFGTRMGGQPWAPVVVERILSRPLAKEMNGSSLL